MSTWGRRRGDITLECLPHGNDGGNRSCSWNRDFKTLKDIPLMLRGAWMDLDTFYVLGCCWPSPLPNIVHNSKKVISEESKRQILEKEDTFAKTMWLHCMSVVALMPSVPFLNMSQKRGSRLDWGRSSWSLGHRSCSDRPKGLSVWLMGWRPMQSLAKDGKVAPVTDLCWFRTTQGLVRACFL